MTLNSRRNWLGVILEHCFIWFGNLEIKNIGAEVFREL